jgi:hypothetical protein
MEEIISEDYEQNTYIDIEDSEEFSSCCSSDIVNKKSTNKMIHIILLSVAWCTKLKNKTKIGYNNVYDREDFMWKLLKSFIHVEAEDECDNNYNSID